MIYCDRLVFSGDDGKYTIYVPINSVSKICKRITLFERLQFVFKDTGEILEGTIVSARAEHGLYVVELIDVLNLTLKKSINEFLYENPRPYNKELKIFYNDENNGEVYIKIYDSKIQDWRNLTDLEKEYISEKRIVINGNKNVMGGLK